MNESAERPAGQRSTFGDPHNPESGTRPTVIRETVQMPELRDLQHPDGTVCIRHPLTLADTLDAAAGTLEAERQAGAA